RIGPYPILVMVLPHAYRIKLPSSIKIHPVRSITELDLAPSDPVPGQPTPRAPPVFVDGLEEQAIDEVIDSRMFRKEAQYLVKWTGYQDPTWNKAEYMVGSG